MFPVQDTVHVVSHWPGARVMACSIVFTPSPMEKVTFCAGASGVGVMVASTSTAPETVCPLVRLLMMTLGTLVLAEAAGTVASETSRVPPRIKAAVRG